MDSLAPFQYLPAQVQEFVVAAAEVGQVLQMALLAAVRRPDGGPAAPRGGPPRDARNSLANEKYFNLNASKVGKSQREYPKKQT